MGLIPIYSHLHRAPLYLQSSRNPSPWRHPLVVPLYNIQFELAEKCIPGRRTSFNY